MSAGTAGLNQTTNIGETADMTVVLDQTTAQPHATEHRPVDENDSIVVSTVGVERLPLAHVHPVYTPATVSNAVVKVRG